LEQIEQALYADDPKFASAVRSINVRRHYRRRLLRSVLLFAVGVGMLVAGLVIRLLPLEAAGLAVMLAGAVLTLVAWRRMAAHRPGTHPVIDRRRPAAVPRPGLRARLEERWWRRGIDRDR
jgi:hypothetical protein